MAANCGRWSTTCRHQQNTTMALRQERDLFYLDYQITDGRISRRRQDAELSLGMFCNIFYHCHGRQWTPLEIHFEHPRPLEGREHETLFGAPVFFAQPTNSIVFRGRDLDAPMPEPDSYLFSCSNPSCAGASAAPAATTSSASSGRRSSCISTPAIPASRRSPPNSA
jgi:hypothetical protein